jgi:uncharacterized protein YerC
MALQIFIKNTSPLSGILVYWTHMPRASRKQVDKDTQEELRDNFAFLISALHKSKDIEQFFEDFLTREEKTMLAKRLMLHLMLENEYTALEIQAVLGMSRDTIRIHKDLWNRGGETHKEMIRKIAKREKTKEFWKKVEKILKPLEHALQAKTNMKARSKLLNPWDD